MTDAINIAAVGSDLIFGDYSTQVVQTMKTLPTALVTSWTFITRNLGGYNRMVHGVQEEQRENETLYAHTKKQNMSTFGQELECLACCREWDPCSCLYKLMVQQRA